MSCHKKAKSEIEPYIHDILQVFDICHLSFDQFEDNPNPISLGDMPTTKFKDLTIGVLPPSLKTSL